MFRKEEVGIGDIAHTRNQVGSSRRDARQWFLTKDRQHYCDVVRGEAPPHVFVIPEFPKAQSAESNVPNSADNALLDHRAYLAERGMIKHQVPHKGYFPSFFCGVRNKLPLFDRESKRLLDKHVLSGR